MADDRTPDTTPDHELLEDQARGGDAPRIVEDADVSEVLDDDKLTGDFPPDEPLGARHYGTTAAEERVPEPLEERVRREKTEGSTVGRPDDVGRLVAPDQGGLADDEEQAIAEESPALAPHDRPTGDAATGDRTTAETATEPRRDVSAEEAAVHLSPER